MPASLVPLNFCQVFATVWRPSFGTSKSRKGGLKGAAGGTDVGGNLRRLSIISHQPFPIDFKIILHLYLQIDNYLKHGFFLRYSLLRCRDCPGRGSHYGSACFSKRFQSDSLVHFPFHRERVTWWQLIRREMHCRSVGRFPARGGTESDKADSESTT